MKRLINIAVAMFCACGLSLAAQTLSVTGSQIVDSTGNPVASATITFAPVDRSGNPISYRMGGKGQTVTTAVSATVTNGSFSITLPDVAHTNPLNVCFAVVATDNLSGLSLLGRGYNCVQPSSTITSWCNSTSCNFDNYVPAIGPFPVVQTGPQGIQGPAGPGFISGLASDGNNGIKVQGGVTAGDGSFQNLYAHELLGMQGNNNWLPMDKPGTYINWNQSSGGAESDFTNIGTASSSGGFAFYTAIQGAAAPTTPIAKLDGVGNFSLIGGMQASTLTVTKAIRISGADLNTLTTCGYYDGQNMVNGPGSFGAGWMEIQVVCAADSNFAWQFVYDMAGGASTDLYYSRSRTYGNWETGFSGSNYSLRFGNETKFSRSSSQSVFLRPSDARAIDLLPGHLFAEHDLCAGGHRPLRQSGLCVRLVR